MTVLLSVHKQVSICARPLLRGVGFGGSTSVLAHSGPTPGFPRRDRDRVIAGSASAVGSCFRLRATSERPSMCCTDSRSRLRHGPRHSFATAPPRQSPRFSLTRDSRIRASARHDKRRRAGRSTRPNLAAALQALRGDSLYFNVGGSGTTRSASARRGRFRTADRVGMFDMSGTPRYKRRGCDQGRLAARSVIRRALVSPPRNRRPTALNTLVAGLAIRSAPSS